MAKRVFGFSFFQFRRVHAPNGVFGFRKRVFRFPPTGFAGSPVPANGFCGFPVSANGFIRFPVSAKRVISVFRLSVFLANNRTHRRRLRFFGYSVISDLFKMTELSVSGFLLQITERSARASVISVFGFFG